MPDISMFEDFRLLYPELSVHHPQDHSTGQQHIKQCQGNQRFPAQAHQLVIAEPGQCPANEHKEQNKSDDLCKERCYTSQ